MPASGSTAGSVDVAAIGFDAHLWPATQSMVGGAASDGAGNTSNHLGGDTFCDANGADARTSRR